MRVLYAQQAQNFKHYFFFTSNVDGKALVQVISVFELNSFSLEI